MSTWKEPSENTVMMMIGLFDAFNMASLQSFTTRGSGGSSLTLPVGTTDGT